MISALSSFPRRGNLAAISVAASGTLVSGWVQANDCGRLYAVVTPGVLGSGSVQASFLQATSSAGAGSKALTAGSFAAPAALTVDGTAAEYEFNPEDMDTDNGFIYFKMTLTNTGGTGALLSGSIHAVDPDHKTA